MPHENSSTPSRKSTRVPRLTKHKASGRAVVRLDGRDHYCGAWGTPEAQQEYDRLIRVFLANGRSMPVAGPQALTVTRLCVEYLEFAQGHYRTPDGRPSSEQDLVRLALKRLRALFGPEPAAGLGPLKLKMVRQSMIDEGLARKTINDHTSRIKRCYRWAAENEMVPADVWHGLQSVRGLRRGRSEARETDPVVPVPDAHVQAVLPHLLPEVAALVRLLEVTGMRPGEAVALRMRDIDRQGATWEYRPPVHKTAHHGQDRVVYLGPKAQAILRPFLRADPDAALFSPAVAEQRRQDEQRRARGLEGRTRSSVAACGARAPGEHYTTASLRRAVARACKKAGVPKWNPHRLRHNAATRLRREHGIDAARVVLGHRSAAVTEIYAEIDRTQAKTIMSQVG